MNRAFVSLYLIIVLSIILLGLALNKVWDEVSPPQALDPKVVDLMAIIERVLKTSHNLPKSEVLLQLTAGSSYQAKLISVFDFSKTDIAEKIKQGGVVMVSDAQAHYVYKRLENSDAVLALSYPLLATSHNEFYIPFILLFYSAIALVIFLWVWPLARDLARLAQHAQNLGKDGQQDIIAVSPRSVVYPFAKAFNAMATRLNDIVRTQKEMTLAVSHELRTPLARMKFALALSEGQDLSDILRRQLAELGGDVADMEALINSLLAYATFDQQSQQLNQRQGYIQDLLQNIIARVTGHRSGAITIEVDDESQGQAIVCDWTLMQTALQNLIHNAIGYAHSVVRVTVKVEADYFIIAVDDDGPGVAVNQRERIFESFVRIYSEQNNRSGFGLGLALVKRIMVWHAGSVACEDSPLGGAKFSLRWPR